MTRNTTIALLIALTALPALAFTRDDVLLYVPFDGSLEPAMAAEGTVPEDTGEFSFDEGVVGGALRTGAPGHELS